MFWNGRRGGTGRCGTWPVWLAVAGLLSGVLLAVKSADGQQRGGAAPLVGARVTIRLQSGRSLPDVTIRKIRPGKVAGTVASLTVAGEGGQRARVLGAAGIKQVVAADGSCLLEYDEVAKTLIPPGAANLEAIRKAAQELAARAPVRGPPAARKPPDRTPRKRDPPAATTDPAPAPSAKQPAMSEAQRQAFFEKTGVWLWPELTEREQQEAVARHKQYLARVGRAFGGAMRLVETQYFLFYTDFSARQAALFTPHLDRMYREQCKAFGIEQGRNIWLGKAVLVAFRAQPSFAKFEREFFNRDAGTAQGRTHQRDDGTVVIACHLHADPGAMAMVLTHETTHGFMHRYKSRQHLPAWVEEGAADFLAAVVVPSCKIVQQDQQRSLAEMRRTGRIGDGFFTARKIPPSQYGIASSLTGFMIRGNPTGYRQMIEGVKMGATWQEGLQAAYGVTPEQLVTKYGRHIGIPNLRP